MGQEVRAVRKQVPTLFPAKRTISQSGSYNSMTSIRRRGACTEGVAIMDHLGARFTTLIEASVGESTVVLGRRTNMK